ncbi:MFS transporter [Pseudobutyrivibrio ruminis]|uniref:MFS transporter n=1 Tax=Pseudobutyrivibrio ruminis TaxID=46206 RepID=UPI0026EB91DE|nr:MFS transporter [Pseudobutyrivibrio ruminis]
MENQQKHSGYTKKTAIAYALSQGGGFMLIQATVASYFSNFMTDTVMIPAAAASIIMFIATLWDAINDPIMGGICDRTKTKHGSYRPYLLWVPIVLTVVSFFLFLNPSGLTTTQKVLYIGVFYILYGMGVTALTMPQMALMPAVTKNDKERNHAVTLGMISVAIAFTIASTFTTSFVGFFGSYAPLMIIYGVLAILANLMLFKNTRERYIISTDGRSVWEDLKVFGRHKKLIIMLIIWMMSSVGYGAMFSTSVYYMMYYIMRPDLIGVYMGVLSIGALISMMVLMPFFIKVFKTPTKAFIFTQAVTLVCYVLLFFVGNKNMTVLFVVSGVATAFSAMEQALINFFVNDTIDYIQLKENVSMNGMVSAIKGFSYKCGSTLVSSGVLAVLAASGYIANAIGQEPESAMIAINSLRFALPAATCVILIVCLIFNPVEPHRAEINKMKESMKAIDE